MTTASKPARERMSFRGLGFITFKNLRTYFSEYRINSDSSMNIGNTFGSGL